MHVTLMRLAAVAAVLPAALSAQPVSFEKAALDQMRCESQPQPMTFFQALDRAGRLDRESQFGFDSVSCYEINGGIRVAGMLFHAICGFEEDPTTPGWDDYFYRGPGTSPGQFVSFQSRAPVAEMQAWARAEIGGPNRDKIVGRPFDADFARSAVECKSWMVD